MADYVNKTTATVTPVGRTSLYMLVCILYYYSRVLLILASSIY